MAGTPEKCPTCFTVVPEGAPRCPGCGRVFGEENRCPHCHAIAAVRSVGGATVCAACGKPRTGATGLGDTVGGGTLVPTTREGKQQSTDAMMLRARGRVQRGFGVLTLAGGVIAAAALAVIVPGSFGLALAAVGGVLGVGLGALTVRAGAKNMEKARARERQAKELVVVDAAREAGGRLTASEAAAALRVSVAEADELLTAMVGDGSRVDVEVDSEGVLRYVFRELVRAPVQVRVETAEEQPEEVEIPAQKGEREDRA